MVGQNAKKRVNPSLDYAGTSTLSLLGTHALRLLVVNGAKLRRDNHT